MQKPKIPDVDLRRGGDLVWRDLEELLSFGVFGLVATAVIAGLPIAAFILTVRGRRFAMIALLVSLLMWATWFAHYASGSSANPGLYGLGFLLLVAAFGWIVIGTGLLAPWRRAPFKELLAVKALLRPSPESIIDLRRPEPRRRSKR